MIYPVDTHKTWIYSGWRDWLLLKELRYDILSHFFDGLNCGSSVRKPRNNCLLRKENTKGLILKQKGTRIAEDGEDWKGLEITISKSFAIFLSKYTNDDVTPLTESIRISVIKTLENWAMETGSGNESGNAFGSVNGSGNVFVRIIIYSVTASTDSGHLKKSWQNSVKM